MKKKASRRNRKDERDTMRPEYDFSAAVRGVTAARYAQGANIAVPEPDVLEHRPGTRTVVAAGLPTLVKWIVKHEPKYPFFSIKFLREKVFARDPVVQEALQFAIDNGILETYDQPNPKNPAWPTKACRLKRDHPVVQGILGETDTP